MLDREDSDSDAPEEFTSEQGVQQDEEIRKLQKENKSRVAREGKERRRLWAQWKTPQPSKGDESALDQDEVETETETKEQPEGSSGMLPSDIVQKLAAREKKVFLSDSEDENTESEPLPNKKKPKTSGAYEVKVNDKSPPQCLQNSLEFLKKKKMQVSRSSAVLKNSNQALRLISTSGLLSKKY